MMKIHSLNTYSDSSSNSPLIQVVIATGATDISAAISSVLALFSSASSYNADDAARTALQAARVAPIQTATVTEILNTAPVAPVTSSAPPARTRARASAPTLSVVETVTPPAAAAEVPPVAETRRRRVVAEAPAPEVKKITDADLTKACSNAAAIIGPEIITVILGEFKVKSVNELAPDVRELFLAEVDGELATAYAAAADAKAAASA